MYEPQGSQVYDIILRGFVSYAERSKEVTHKQDANTGICED